MEAIRVARGYAGWKTYEAAPTAARRLLACPSSGGVPLPRSDAETTWSGVPLSPLASCLPFGVLPAGVRSETGSVLLRRAADATPPPPTPRQSPQSRDSSSAVQAPRQRAGDKPIKSRRQANKEPETSQWSLPRASPAGITGGYLVCVVELHAWAYPPGQDLARRDGRLGSRLGCREDLGKTSLESLHNMNGSLARPKKKKVFCRDD